MYYEMNCVYVKKMCLLTNFTLTRAKLASFPVLHHALWWRTGNEARAKQPVAMAG